MKTMGRNRVMTVLSAAVFVALGLALGGYKFWIGDITRGMLGVASALFLLIPPAMRRLHITCLRLQSLVFLFCIFAYDLGCVLQLYDAVPLFDKAAHFLSGIVFAILGYCLFFYLTCGEGYEKKERPVLASSYALFFSTFVAVVWEVVEFSGFLLLGHDSQHHLTTGVFDTMQDLISCLVGSLICVVSFLLYAKKDIRLVTGWVLEEFEAECEN